MRCVTRSRGWAGPRFRFEWRTGYAIIALHEVVQRHVAPAFSERKQREAAREEAAALRSVSALAAAAAHEINNPLSVVLAQAGFLGRELGPPARGRLDAIQTAAERIAQVVTDMSRIVRLEQVPSSPSLPDMLDLRGSTAEAAPDSTDEPTTPP
jgi:signal transduction histidine kinase